jgi:hypothetical protein
MDLDDDPAGRTPAGLDDDRAYAAIVTSTPQGRDGVWVTIPELTDGQHGPCRLQPVPGATPAAGDRCLVQRANGRDDWWIVQFDDRDAAPPDLATQAELDAVNTALDGRLDALEAAAGAFHAYSDDNAFTIVADGTFRKVKLSAEEFDASSWFDVVNWRFVPQRSGVYQLNAMVTLVDLLNAGDPVTAAIFKNGAAHRRFGRQEVASADTTSSGGGALVRANGTTDFFELFVAFSSSGSPTRRILSGADGSWMSGFYVGSG